MLEAKDPAPATQAVSTSLPLVLGAPSHILSTGTTHPHGIHHQSLV